MLILRLSYVVFVLILFTAGSRIESQASQTNETDIVWFTGSPDPSVSGIYRLNIETGNTELMERGSVLLLPLRFSNDSNWVVYGNASGINLRSLQNNEWQNPYPALLNSTDATSEWQLFYPAPLNRSVPTRLELAWLPDDRYFLYTFLDDPSMSGVPYGGAGSIETRIGIDWRERDCSQIAWHSATQRFALICTDQDQSSSFAVFWNQDPVPYRAGEFTSVLDNVDLASHTYQWTVQSGIETLVYTQADVQTTTLYVMQNDGTLRSTSLSGIVSVVKTSDDQNTLALIEQIELSSSERQDCIVTADLRLSNLAEGIIEHTCTSVVETQNGQTGFSGLAWYSDSQHIALISSMLNQGIGIDRIDLATGQRTSIVTGFDFILDIAVTG